MRFLKNSPVFLFLLPLFFVLHGFSENYDFVPVKDALLLTGIYTACALTIAWLFWLFYHDFTKASLIAFGVMGYHFFFGTIQDLLRKYFAETFITRYSFILPVSFLFFGVIIVWLKRRKSPFKKLLPYLNALLLLLITVDAGSLLSKMVRKKKSPAGTTHTGFVKCDTCKKPDIFFIILDEYSGNTALKERFNFDNSGFENKLRNRGFYIIPNSSSNYNYTPFSIASMLNMGYLDLDMKTKGPGNLKYCYRMIRDSRAIKFLEANDYQFYNYSIFDFAGQPAIKSENFLPTRTRLITSQTFLSRIWNDILFNVGTGNWGIQSINKKIVYSHLHNNDNFIRLTLDIAAREAIPPKFVYTHLMMPHYPYYFDSHGRALAFDSLVEGRQQDQHNYVEYLQYCNRKILQLTDDILKMSSSPPLIILSGDHGFRYFPKKEDHKYCFMNLMAIYLPAGDYHNFYSNMSAANLFPVIFNTQFQQHIPLQKDSTIYLWE
jgi:hypothetical protein